MNRKYFLLLLIVTILSGCASGAKFTRPENAENDYATLYIYRPSQFKFSALAPNLKINDKQTPRLLNGGYQVYRLKPGSYTISAPWDVITWSITTAPVTLDLAASEIAYVRLYSDVSLLKTTSIFISLSTDGMTALKEFEKTNPDDDITTRYEEMFGMTSALLRIKPEVALREIAETSLSD